MRYRLTDAERLDACGQDPSWFCGWVADRTESVALARAGDVLLDRPLRILVILFVAFLVSRLLRRLVDRFVRRLAKRSLARLADIERRAPRLTLTRPFEDPAGKEPLDRPAGAVAAGTAEPADSGTTSASDALGAADPGPVEPGLMASTGPTTAGPDPVGNGRLHLRIDTLVAVLVSLSNVAVWALAAIMILAQFDVSLAPLFAGAGVLGVALGFGAQSVVADFLSGFFMLFEDQFGVGDVVDLGDASGTVESLSLRTTTIRDVDGTVWHIRNSEIRRVGNKSQLWSRAVLDIEVAYDTDVRLAAGIIQRVADELWHDAEFTAADILDPPQVLGIEQLGVDGVTIRLVVRTDPADQWIVGRELRLRIKEALDQAGMEIPFPQRTVWIRQDQASAGGPAS